MLSSWEASCLWKLEGPAEVEAGRTSGGGGWKDQQRRRLEGPELVVAGFYRPALAGSSWVLQTSCDGGASPENPICLFWQVEGFITKLEIRRVVPG